MRDFILLYINGERHEIRGEQAFLTVSDFLRYEQGLTGTKVVCAEGDCAACTVLVSRYKGEKMQPYYSQNSCIAFIYNLDLCHIITVEGLAKQDELHQAQAKMRECHGSQCGYCTPGFVCSLAYLAEDMQGKQPGQQKIKNYLTGNLCRCTGYEPIIKAGEEMDYSKINPFAEIYPHSTMAKIFETVAEEEVIIAASRKSIHLPVDFSGVKKSENKKMISGSTDMGVLYNKGKFIPRNMISLNNVEAAYRIENSSDSIKFGAKVSLTQVEKACEKDFPEFSRMLHIFAAPGIKNSGTLVGNLVNASPIADTIPFLMVNEAVLTLQQGSKTREVNINDFYLDGYKNLDLADNEIVTHVTLPKSKHEYKLYKVSLRKDLDISAVTFGARYSLREGKITDLNLAFGGVGSKVLNTPGVKREILEHGFTLDKLFPILLKEIAPMSDLRGSLEFRNQLACNLLTRFYDETLGLAGQVSV